MVNYIVTIHYSVTDVALIETESLHYGDSSDINLRGCFAAIRL